MGEQTNPDRSLQILILSKVFAISIDSTIFGHIFRFESELLLYDALDHSNTFQLENSHNFLAT